MADSRNQIIYWHGVVGDETLKQEYSKVIGKLLRGDKSAKYHKLVGHDLYSAYEDGKDRLIVTTEYFDNKPYLVLLKGDKNHQYRLDDRVLERYKERKKEEFEKQVAEQEKEKSVQEQVWQEIDVETLTTRFAGLAIDENADFNYKPAQYNDGKFIVFNTDQEKAIKARFPLIITGAAGSGKTCVALEQLLEDCEENAVLIVQSPFLAAILQEQLDRLIVAKPHLQGKVAVRQYEDLLREQDAGLVGKTTVEEDECLEWLESRIKTKKSKAKVNNQDAMMEALRNNREKLYQEFRLLCGYTKEQYLNNLGEDESLFPKEDRKWVYELYEAYQQSLLSQHKVDLSFYKATFKAKYGRIIVDEAQDFSLLELSQIRELGKEHCFLMDSNQNVSDYLSKLPYVKKLLGGHPTEIQLPGSYRCASDIADFANEWLQIKFEATGGTSDQKEYSKIELPDELKKKKGETRWVSDTSDESLCQLIAENQKKYGAAKVAVVIDIVAKNRKEREKIRKEYAKKFGTELIFTPAEIKGLEYCAVIRYRPFSTKAKFEAVNKKLREEEGKEKVKKEKVNRAKAGMGEVDARPDFNREFTAFTRATDTLIICEDENEHKIDVLAKRMKACISTLTATLPTTISESNSSQVLAPQSTATQLSSPTISTSTAAVSELSTRDKRELEEEAKKLIRAGLIERAKAVYVNTLGKTVIEFDKLEEEFNPIKIRARKEKQKRQEQEEKRAQEKKESSPELPVRTSSLDAFSASRSETSLASAPVSKERIPTASTNKKHTTSPKPPGSVKELTRYLEQPDVFVKLFAKDKNGSCLFVDMVNDENFRENLKIIASNKPQLFANMPLSYLFEKYLAQIPFISGITLRFPELNTLLEAFLSNLSDDSLNKLINRLYENYIYTDRPPHKFATVISVLLATDCKLFIYLLDKYPQISRILAKAEWQQKEIIAHQEIGPLNLVELLMMGSKAREEVLIKLFKQNSDFFTNTSPQLMFKFYNVQVGNEVKKTNLFNTILRYSEDNIELLNNWLLSNAWVPCILNIYKSHSPDYLHHITQRIINSLLYLWNNSDRPPILRLLEAQPSFLLNIIANGFFVVDEYYSSTFSLLAADTCYHRSLLDLFKNKPELYGQLELAQCFEYKKGKGTLELPPVLNLSRSKGGRQLLLSILIARPDILERLSSVEILFGVFSTPIKSGSRLTCLYQLLANSEIANDFIELLKSKNSYLTPGNIDQELAKNGLDFLTKEEDEKVERVQNNLTIENLTALMHDPAARRLLFKSRADGSDAYLHVLLKTQAGRNIIKVHFEQEEHIEYVQPNDLFKLMLGGVKLVEFLLCDPDSHWMLRALFNNDDFAYQFIKEYGNCLLSDKNSLSNTITMLCRYYPELAANLAERAQQKKLKELTPFSLIFGNPKLASCNFCFLARKSASHELLLSLIENEPTLLGLIQAVQLGLTLAESKSDEASTPLSSLAQTEAGIKILLAYIRDPGRATSLANTKLLLTPIKSQSEHINGRTIIDLLTHAADVDADIVKSLSDKARFALINSKNTVKQILGTSDAEILFRPDKNNDCIFINKIMADEKTFVRDLMEVFKSNPELFKGISVSSLFHFYKNPAYTIRTIFGYMLAIKELYDLLEFILSDLTKESVALLINEFFKDQKTKDITNPRLLLMLQKPKIMVFLQEKYPAFAASFTTAVLTIPFKSELSPLQSLSDSKEGCDFLDNQLRLNRNSIMDISPEAMFDETANGIMVFQKILRNQRANSQLLTCWLENEAWIDYIINNINSNSKLLPSGYNPILDVIASILAYGRVTNHHSFLRLLQKKPDIQLWLLPRFTAGNFVYIPSTSFLSSREAHSVFGLLCDNPLFHSYLEENKIWNKLNELTIEKFITDLQSGPNIAAKLSRTDKGLIVLYNILKSRSDICKQVATTEELFKRVDFTHVAVPRPSTCLYNMLKQSDEGEKILTLLRQTNPKLTPELLASSQKKNGLKFLSDDELAIVEEFRNNINVQNFVSLIGRPNGYDLLTTSSAIDDRANLLIEMASQHTDFLCDVFEKYPEFMRIFPHDFLIREYYSSHGTPSKYFDKLLAEPDRKFLKLVGSFDQKYFACIDFKFLFQSRLFEIMLQDQQLHFILFKLIKDPKKADDFVANYRNVKISEVSAFSMVCKFCPEFALELATAVSPRTQPVHVLFGGTSQVQKESAPMNFYWLARHVNAHQKLHEIFSAKANVHLLALITPENISRALPAPFPPNESSSPLDALVKTTDGRKILELFKKLPNQQKGMATLIDKHLRETGIVPEAIETVQISPVRKRK